jgi:hypothetical protein
MGFDGTFMGFDGILNWQRESWPALFGGGMMIPIDL